MEKVLDWNKYIDKSAETVSEGIVMLKNDNNALPLRKDSEVAVFGRIQLNYYKSGTGSGGLVNVSRVIGITDGLQESGSVKVNEELLNVYKEWTKEHPFDFGDGWGGEPWSQEEMPVDDALAEKISNFCQTAIVIFGRTAGEENDNRFEKGAYLLSDGEESMLRTVRKHFRKVIVLLNVGSIIDMNFVEDIKPDAVLYVWQGGMIGGTGTADVLTGKVSPSGKLPDTIAYSVSDYPSHEYFGNTRRNFYCEDIYVGYRYFETFAPEKVQYPFGFGLSYTTFEHTVTHSELNDGKITIEVSVKNTGNYSGKEVIQLYVGSLPGPEKAAIRPVRELKGFEKVELQPGESKEVSFTLDKRSFAFYNSEIPGWYVEDGEYEISIGKSSRELAGSLTVTVHPASPIRPHYTMESTVGDLLKNEKAKARFKAYMAKMFPGQDTDEELLMMEAVMDQVPVHSICSFHPNVTLRELQEIVDEANR